MEDKIKEEFKKVLDALPYYAMLVDETHHIILANSAVTKALDVGPKEIVGGYCPEVIHGVKGRFPGCPLEEAIEKGIVATEKEFFDEDTGRWFRSAIYPTGQKTREGKEIFFHTSQDITDIKKAGELLKRAYRMNRDILEKSPFGIYVVDKSKNGLLRGLMGCKQGMN